MVFPWMSFARPKKSSCLIVCWHWGWICVCLALFHSLFHITSNYYCIKSDAGLISLVEPNSWNVVRHLWNIANKRQEATRGEGKSEWRERVRKKSALLALHTVMERKYHSRNSNNIGGWFVSFVIHIIWLRDLSLRVNARARVTHKKRLEEEKVFFWFKRKRCWREKGKRPVVAITM